ncbi:FIST signal transduction protein [Gemmobacter denitrificans]|uniref:FIST N-terminal domain-containing protein n=1 Tax=Gemmobacter denitrificans TaxID=3123040 RepID=A0ABU8BY53_9RHOB
MQISTAQSAALLPDAAMADIAAALQIDRRGHPDFLALHFGAAVPAEILAAAARPFSQALHGGTSCQGIMSQAGLGIATGGHIGAFAIWDAAGSYGSASRCLGQDAAEAARLATLEALAAAGRGGEIPPLVWLTPAPGREEQVIAGVRSVTGADATIVGGSAADNDVTGQWAQFGPSSTHRDGVVVSVLFPSTGFALSYQGGYAPTGETGIVTRVEGRKLIEIDHRPASAVYHGWTDGVVPLAVDGPRSILAASTLWPLGRITRHVAGVPFHLLAHPAVAHLDGSLDLFADFAVGDRVWQMRGSADSLVARASQVAVTACADLAAPPAGALVVYCGGCMLAVRDRMEQVCGGITEALGGAPWLGLFSFGEQGMSGGGQASHGNLMISCTAFAR